MESPLQFDELGLLTSPLNIENLVRLTEKKNPNKPGVLFAAKGSYPKQII